MSELLDPPKDSTYWRVLPEIWLNYATYLGALFFEHYLLRCVIFG